MEFDYRDEAVSGATSTAIALTVTYTVSLAYPTQDLQWALTAVAIASFFSGFFGNHYAE